ncbi:autotransporter outer membrane beta-barrel domain-containing protein [Stenotrophomonas sp. MH181796]|uniref:autotransporter domain-containing protein n=1 Tax=Stenotrophomonas sp. MH181796 TaxID=2339228 RepID=UPI00129C773F|nr:autotransporter outer membrane beta-barrel domain-containing protein [Stenotrophomonas sp. MH181796]MRI43473.1 autotransporter outer membrane beta-barrel domain-containing protein [Stenotrophomonas sp. MH181796]
MRKSRLSIALAGLAGAGALAGIEDAGAMNYHVRGDRVYMSGGVTLADVAALPVLLARANAEGRPIREVVLRTSNGGVLLSGEWLQGVIRISGLNTIVSGHCVSSCSIMQSGGVERYLAGDLPIVDSVQIHAASSSGNVVYAPSPRMTQIYTGNYGGGMDAELLRKAMYDVVQPNGLLVFSDPGRSSGASVTFDPVGDGVSIESFNGHSIYSNNIITRVGYRAPGDTLWVDKDIGGDINPGYLRTNRELHALVDRDAAHYYISPLGSYLNLAIAAYNFALGEGGSVQAVLREPGIQALLHSTLLMTDEGGAILGDSAGVIRLLNGAVWRTGETTGADLMLVENGVIALEGGGLRTDELRVLPAGTVVGHGDVAGTAMDLSALISGTRPSWREDGFNRLRVFGTLMPRGGDLVTHGRVNIMPGGKVLFDVTENDDTGRGRLRVGSFFDQLSGKMNDGALLVSRGAFLELNVAQGYYGQDFHRDLVQGPISQGGFEEVVRLGDTGYSASITSGDVFRPRHNSLLSFNVKQTADGLWLTANPGFEQLGLFANGSSGDGLGRALATASDRKDRGLRSLLGALQFADRDVIAQQSGALRGDAHASLRLADNALLGSIGNMVQQHQAAMRSAGGDADGLALRVAQSMSAQPGMRHGSLFNQLAMHLVEPAAASEGGRAAGSERNHGIWARGFASHGRIDADGGVAGLSHTIGGIVVGADTRVADDRVTLGVSVAAADMSTKASDGSGFTGDVRALDVGGYLDATYARGYLSAAVRYTDLRHDTRRSINGIEGLQQPLRAKYSNDAISARAEHAFSFTTGKGLVVQPLLPVVDYARTSATRFNEGQGAGALVGRSGSLESIRVGAGLQLFKTFEGNNGERITPRARVVWQKELGDSQARYNTGFAAAPDLVFGSNSQVVGEQVLAWNVGVTSRASERLSVMVDYVGERRDGQLQNGVMLGLGYKF